MAEKEEDVSSLINQFKSTSLGDKSDSGKKPYSMIYGAHYLPPKSSQKAYPPDSILYS